MPYNEKLADRVREALAGIANVEEKKMFRGVTFMVNDKMCISVSGERLMCRIGAEKQQEAVERPGCSEMIMRGNVMKDFVYVSPAAFKNKKDFDYWIKLSLDFNKHAKASKKK